MNGSDIVISYLNLIQYEVLSNSSFLESLESNENCNKIMLILSMNLNMRDQDLAHQHISSEITYSPH